MMVVHIDDRYVIAQQQSIDKLIQDIQDQGLKLKVSPNARYYLSCDIIIDDDYKTAWVGQETLLNKMEKKFEVLLKKRQIQFKTPGTPGQVLIRPKEDDERLNAEDQHTYRSGVGTLIQFANKTRPDLSNPVRELTKSMDQASSGSFKEMIRVMKYLLDTRKFGLKIQPSALDPSGNWTMRIYSDSDWASCTETRKSITGFVILLQNTPIMWRSQSQKAVSLSSTEAEYYATAEAAKEIKFICQVLESLNVPIKKPIIVHIDNVGAIFIAENASATKHTRHIDARYHFVREYIIDGYIKIIFVNSKENIADMFTKNVTSEIYELHVDTFLIHKEVIKISSEELNKIGKFGSRRVSEISHSDISMSHDESVMSHRKSVEPNQQLTNNNKSSNDRKLTRKLPSYGKFTDDRKRVISYLKGNYNPSTFKQYNVYKQYMNSHKN
jgi:hypothetical protein